MANWIPRSGLLAIALCAAHASAYDIPTALANLAEDYADCVVYYELIVQMAGSTGSKESTAKFQTTADNALRLYLVAMNEKTEGYPKSKAKLELHFKQNSKILKEEGLDRLTLMYSDLCKSMMENPDGRMNYWLDKK